MMEPASGALISKILDCAAFAVVGASRDPNKYGHLVYKSLKQAGYTTYAVNPTADEIDGDPAYPSLDSIPGPIDCVVCVVPPMATEAAVRDAGRLRMPYMWMQTGAESEAAVNAAQAVGIRAVHSGPCIMVAIAARRKR